MFLNFFCLFFFVVFFFNLHKKLHNEAQSLPIVYYEKCKFSTVILEHLSRDMTNQQNECAPSEDSDQCGHPPSLIRFFAVRSVGS